MKNGAHRWIVVGSAITLAAIALLLGLLFHRWAAVSAEERRARAEKFIAQENWQRAADELQTHVQEHPDDEYAVSLLGRSLAKLGKHLQSALAWNLIPETSPNRSAALYWQGAEFLAAQRAANAEQSWKRCVALGARNPRDPFVERATMDLAQLCWLQDRTADALATLHGRTNVSDAISASAASLPLITSQLKVRLVHPEPATAIPQLEAFVAADPADLDSRRSLGLTLAKADRIAEARKHLQTCLEQAPSDLRNWEAWIRVCVEAGDFAGGERAMSMLPADAKRLEPLLILEATIAEHRDDAAQTERTCRDVLQVSPRDAQTLAKLASALRQLGRPDEARQVADTLHEIDRDLRALQNVYGRLQQSWNPTANECIEIGRLCDSVGFQQEAIGWRRRAETLTGERVEPGIIANVAPPPRPSLERFSWPSPPEQTPVNELFADPATASAGSANLEAAFARSFQTGNPSTPAAPTQDRSAIIRFADVTEKSGIDFTYFRGETGKSWIVEPNGGGVAWIDIDQDGWLDLYFANGCQLPLSPEANAARSAGSPTNRLFLNGQDGSFSDVTMLSATGDTGYGQGCAVGDFDNDGFPDLYVTNYGRNVLYRNQGDGTFRDVTMSAGVGGEEFSTGAAFADLNRDGILDLYVANYIAFDPARNGVPCPAPGSGQPEYCGPRCCPAAADVLYLGRGDGHFDDVSEESGILSAKRPGFGVLAADVNDDGWPDLYVANDGEPNFLFLNESHAAAPGQFRLRDAGEELGCSRNADGSPQGSMGIACGDFDRDGRLDLGVSNYYLEHYTLYRNLGSAGFIDVSLATGLSRATRTSMGWGTFFLDADSDGWLDLFVANGHINHFGEGRASYAMRSQLFRNRDGATFDNVGPGAGAYFEKLHVARGAAGGDFDNDGREDIVVVHHHEPAALLKNETQIASRSLVLQLIGQTSNRDAFNARVTATWNGTALTDDKPAPLVREVTSSGGFLSANDSRVRFSVPEGVDSVDLTIRWPGGATSNHAGLRPGRTIGLREHRDGTFVAP